MPKTKAEETIGDLQFIYHQGERQFAVIPFADFVKLQKTLITAETKDELALEAFEKICKTFSTFEQAMNEFSSVWGI